MESLLNTFLCDVLKTHRRRNVSVLVKNITLQDLKKFNNKFGCHIHIDYERIGESFSYNVVQVLSAGKIIWPRPNKKPRDLFS